MESNALITIDPEIVSGTPVFTGTRVPVKSLFDWLETETSEEFLENFPSVSREQASGILFIDLSSLNNYSFDSSSSLKPASSNNSSNSASSRLSLSDLS